MNYYRTEYIVKYFTTRGWTIAKEGNIYIYLKPKKPQKFPHNFLLEIPKQDNTVAFNNYIERIINEVPSLVFDENSNDDFRLLFSNNNSIFKYRVFDNETIDGTIPFEKYIDSLDSFKNILTQTVTFVATKKQIFANAKYEVESYLKLCKTLQSEKGSYISKFELPNTTIETVFSKLDTSAVNNKMLDVIQFAYDQILYPHKEIIINENYISDNSEFINYELLYAIKEVYNKTDINNIEFQLSSNENFRRISTEKVIPRLKYFNQYLRKIKSILLETMSIELLGKVKKLSSLAPLTSQRNEVILSTEMNNKLENIKLFLKSDEYFEAIEAHKNEKTVKVKGKARQVKNTLVVYELENFETIQN